MPQQQRAFESQQGRPYELAVGPHTPGFAGPSNNEHVVNSFLSVFSLYRVSDFTSEQHSRLHPATLPWEEDENKVVYIYDFLVAARCVRCFAGPLTTLADNFFHQGVHWLMGFCYSTGQPSPALSLADVQDVEAQPYKKENGKALYAIAMAISHLPQHATRINLIRHTESGLLDREAAAQPQAEMGSAGTSSEPILIDDDATSSAAVTVDNNTNRPHPVEILIDDDGPSSAATPVDNDNFTSTPILIYSDIPSPAAVTPHNNTNRPHPAEILIDDDAPSSAATLVDHDNASSSPILIDDDIPTPAAVTVDSSTNCPHPVERPVLRPGLDHSHRETLYAALHSCGAHRPWFELECKKTVLGTQNQQNLASERLRPQADDSDLPEAASGSKKGSRSGLSKGGRIAKRKQDKNESQKKIRAKLREERMKRSVDSGPSPRDSVMEDATPGPTPPSPEADRDEMMSGSDLDNDLASDQNEDDMLMAELQASFDEDKVEAALATESQDASPLGSAGEHYSGTPLCSAGGDATDSPSDPNDMEDLFGPEPNDSPAEPTSPSPSPESDRDYEESLFGPEPDDSPAAPTLPSPESNRDEMMPVLGSEDPEGSLFLGERSEPDCHSGEDEGEDESEDESEDGGEEAAAAAAERAQRLAEIEEWGRKMVSYRETISRYRNRILIKRETMKLEELCNEQRMRRERFEAEFGDL